MSVLRMRTNTPITLTPFTINLVFAILWIWQDFSQLIMIMMVECVCTQQTSSSLYQQLVVAIINMLERENSRIQLGLEPRTFRYLSIVRHSYHCATGHR